MAENAPKAQPVAEAVPAKAARGKMLWIVLSAVMAVEGVGVFMAAKMFSGSPDAAAASDSSDSHGAPADTHGDADHKPPASSEKSDAGHGSEKKDDHSKASTAHGSMQGDSTGMPTDSSAEVKLAECKTFNKETGKLVLFHIRVSVLVAACEADRARRLVEAKQGRVDDRVNTVIRSAEPRHLNEPGLETLKRRLKFELDRIFEDPRLVQEVLIPYLVQSGSGL